MAALTDENRRRLKEWLDSLESPQPASMPPSADERQRIQDYLAGPVAQPTPFAPSRLAEDVDGMREEDLRARGVPVSEERPPAPAGKTPVSSPATRRATPRADVKPLDSSRAVRAGEALLARLKSPGNGSALPDSVRQWARKGQPAQSEDASGSGGGEGGNGTSRMDWARLIDSGAATVAGANPATDFYDAVERRGERKDKLKAGKEQLAQDLAMKAQDLRRRSQDTQDRLREQSLSREERERHNREAEQQNRERDAINAELRRMGYSLQGEMVSLRREAMADKRNERAQKTSGGEGDKDYWRDMRWLAEKVPQGAQSSLRGIGRIRQILNDGSRLNIGLVVGSFPRWLASDEGREVRQLRQDIANQELRNISGAAVTENEQKRYDVARGTISGATTAEEFRRGVDMMEAAINDTMQRIYAGARPGAVRDFQEASGIRPSNGAPAPAPRARTQQQQPEEMEVDGEVWRKTPDGDYERVR